MSFGGRINVSALTQSIRQEQEASGGITGITLGRLTWYIRRKTVGGKKIYDTMYGAKGEEEPTPEEKRKLDGVSAAGIMTRIAALRINATQSISPFNLAKVLEEMRIDYTIEDDNMIIRSMTSKYAIPRIQGTPLFDPSKIKWVSNHDENNKVEVAYKWSRKVYAPLHTVIKNIYIWCTMVELKNGVFYPIATVDQEKAIMSMVKGYTPSMSVILVDLMTRYLLENAGGKPGWTARGSELGHSIYVYMGDNAPTEQLVLVGIISDAFERVQQPERTIQIKKEGGQVVQEKVSASIVVPIQDAVKRKIMTAVPRAVESKLRVVDAGAGINEITTVRGVSIEVAETEKMIAQAQSYAFDSRDMRGTDDRKAGDLTQCAYTRHAISSNAFRASVIRTDFSWLPKVIKKDTVGIIIEGMLPLVGCDVVHWIHSTNKDKIIFFVTTDTSAHTYFSDILGSVYISDTVDKAIALYQITVKNDDSISTIKKSCLYFNLKKTQIETYIVKQKSALLDHMKKNQDSVIAMIRIGKEYQRMVAYMPLVMNTLFKQCVAFSSCTPHNLLLPLLVCGQSDFSKNVDFKAEISSLKRPTWQYIVIGHDYVPITTRNQKITEELRTVDRCLRYCKMSVLANVAKNCFGLTQITPYNLIESTWKKRPDMVEPAYSRPIWNFAQRQVIGKYKTAIGAITYNEIEAMVEDAGSNMDQLKILLNDPTTAAAVQDALTTHGQHEILQQMADDDDDSDPPSGEGTQDVDNSEGSGHDDGGSALNQLDNLDI